MIEWILLGLLGAGALSGSKKKDTLASRPARTSGGSSYATNRQASETERKQKIEAWRAQWEPTIDRSGWIPAGTVDRILATFPAPEQPSTWLNRFNRTDPIRDELSAEFEAHNQTFLARQKERLKSFFDTIEKNPLTDEQVKACVCMDGRVQIVAAAGSGKTSTMVAKAGYALHEGLAQGSQILLLAFNADAANELAERTQDRLSELAGATELTSRTFHGFGLHVIAKATGKKPSLAPWIENAGEDIKMIVSIIDDLCQNDLPH